MLEFLIAVFAVGLLALGWLMWSLLRRKLFERRVDRARREFVRDFAELEREFISAAAASGKPRGLNWKQCEFQNNLLLARDRASGELIGLVPVTISFTAIEGGAMEDVEAVGNLRAATAVLVWNEGRWTTRGRAVFNLEPREVLERYADSLDAL